MERYSHLQTLPNSPLTPLTPLCENTAFDFNFGGDGSLDVYIDNIRQKHRVEQELNTTLATKKENQTEPKRYSEKFLRLRNVFESKSQGACPLHLNDPPKKYTCHGETNKENCSPVMNHIVHHKDCQVMKNMQQQYVNHQQQKQQPHPFITPKAPVKIMHTEATPDKLPSDYVATPTNVRSHLKLRNSNISVNNQSKKLKFMQQVIKQKHHQYRAFLQTHLGSPNNRGIFHIKPFRQASPVALRPLCPVVAKILQKCGLTMYCSIFQREEIDMLTFNLLQLHDLQQMGITDAKHCDMLMTEIRFSRQIFNK